MSPTDYDPKEVAALQPESLDQVATEATEAFDRAADLDALAAAHTAHMGPRSPVALARRELGALPPQARADAGRRVNAAMTAIQSSYDARRHDLELARDERVLREETVDVTLPWDRAPRGARHPL